MLLLVAAVMPPLGGTRTHENGSAFRITWAVPLARLYAGSVTGASSPRSSLAKPSRVPEPVALRRRVVRGACGARRADWLLPAMSPVRGAPWGDPSMDVLHARCAGLDVHKKTVVACVRRVDPAGK